ncbi:MAG: hypothetical protein ACRDTQ_11105, partial [Micromonosporaceae bacterium]
METVPPRRSAATVPPRRSAATVPPRRSAATVPPRRWWARMAVTVATLALPLAALPAAASPNPEAGEGDGKKVEHTVRKEIAEKGYSSFWVVLDSEADLSKARKTSDKTQKAQLVRDAKRRHAATTQAGLKNLLDKNHAEYTSYWIDNSLYVTGD